MLPYKYLAYATLAVVCNAQLSSITDDSDKLTVVKEWKMMDYDYPSDEKRLEDIRSGAFIPENIVPVGVETHGDRLFISIPRWKVGVPASLNFVWLNDTNKSPKLIPYPNWEAYRKSDPETVSVYRMRADHCGRLWVLDPAYAHKLNDSNSTVLKNPALLVYDLTTDTLLRNYKIPENQLSEKKFLANLAVDDTNCDDAFVYMADLTVPIITVYSWEKDSSWRITHPYFDGDQAATSFNILGDEFTWTDKIFGIALSAPDEDNHRTLYFHPMISFDEFAVSTKYLMSPEEAELNGDKFINLGTRGPASQAGASFVHKGTGVLFYNLFNKNAVACWNTAKPYEQEHQGIVYTNNTTLVLPCDLNIDIDDNLWILTNRLHLFMKESLDYDDFNFRILKGPIKEAIKDTVCN